MVVIRLIGVSTSPALNMCVPVFRYSLAAEPLPTSNALLRCPIHSVLFEFRKSHFESINLRFAFFAGKLGDFTEYCG